jgi:hypothetical protein
MLMTLNITVVNNFGAWQSSDHRITDPKSGRILDDKSMKHIVLRCPDGTALVAYAGIGRIGDITISDWLREVLRGDKRTVQESVIQIRESATADLAKLLYKNAMMHMFSIAAFIQEKPLIIQIRNFSVTRTNNNPRLVNKFLSVAISSRLGCSAIFPDICQPEDRKMLVRIATKNPRDPKEYAKLLGMVNSRTALSNGNVSPECVVTHMPKEGLPCHSEYFKGKNNRIDIGPNVPVVLFGVDVTDMQKLNMEQFYNLKRGVSDPDIERKMDNIAKEAGKSKDRIKEILDNS